MEVTYRLIKVRLGGRDFIDIRRCHNGKPTKRGISIPPEKVEEIIGALQNLNGQEVHIK